jgi:hypothetical protein
MGLNSYGYLLLNFCTRLSGSLYPFFNNTRCCFAMQVATLPRKLAVDQGVDYSRGHFRGGAHCLLLKHQHKGQCSAGFFAIREAL